LFGAGMGTDAFFVAFRIPNFFRRLFAEGAFAQAFVPVLSEYKAKRTPAEIQALLDHTTAVLGLVLLAVTAVGILLAPLLILLFAPGFHGEAGKFDLAVGLLRITFPYLFFISLTALAGAILNSYRRFAIPAFTPVLLNLALISSAIWLAPHMQEPIQALAWGVFIAGIVQLLFQLPFIINLKLLPRPWRGRDRDGVKRIFILMLPVMFGVSVSQINVMIDTLMASFLVSGSITWLYYADRMMEFPLGVFGIALATVILPQLSDKHARGAQAEFSRTLDWGLRWILLITLPALAGLAVLAGPIMITLFQYDEFTSHDATMAAQALMAFALGLPGFVLIKVLA
ncbi:MAG: murein biosynthesis integral membrane protein MurJ, partial [Gammaproteobacteria bacterium]